MHDAVGSIMLSHMRKGKALPDRLCDYVDKMADNMDEKNVGYWALSDVRNGSFVRE